MTNKEDLSQIFGQATKSKSGKAWYIIFTRSATATLVCTVLLVSFKETITPILESILLAISFVGFLLSIISLLVLSVMLGLAAGKKESVHQSSHVFSRLLLHLFFTAFIITLILAIFVMPIVRD